ncbi:MAG: hypothetical protein ABIV04_03025 [Massilia sp.]
MKNIIQIIGINQVAGRSKKTGNDYDMRMAQCIVERVDPVTGAPAPLIGELVLPEKFKDTPPGRYEVEFEVSVSQDKRIGSVVSVMTPVPVAARAAAPAAAPSPVKP